jgi:protein-S-isoprenylcysteine O-methyltransferase Ste14
LIEAMLSKFFIHIFHRSATGSGRMRILLTPLGPGFFLSLLVLLVIASLYTDRMVGFPGLISAPINVILSLPLLAGGLFLTFWSGFCFLKARGTPVPFNPPPVLVDTGPYAWSRNPMLTSVFMILFGLGVLLNSVSMIFIFSPLFILLMIWEIRAVEEPELEMRLGEQYIQYKKRVPMFFPRIVTRRQDNNR